MPKVSKPKTKTTDRKILYRTVTVKVLDGNKNEALDGETAKTLLGWVAEKEGENFETNFLLRDGEGRKVRCMNNTNNRPFSMSNCLTIRQDILRRKWKLNRENIIIGETGLILNGQHRLVGLVLACEEWSKDREKWADYWATTPTIETTMAFGGSEDDATVNTIDTAKPRSLADVIFRSPYFDGMPKRDRITTARITDYAVRLLWHRTGASLNAFGLRRTHSEALDFIERHPKLLEAVKHIFEENGSEHKISMYLSPGYAAGMLYLMGSGKSDETEYSKSSRPDESMLNWELWDAAQDFFVLLASGDKKFVPVDRALVSMHDSQCGASIAERTALIAKAWIAFSSGNSPTEARLALQYDVDDDMVHTLAETPVVGGIDRGDPTNEPAEPPPPTPKELEERKRIEDKKRENNKSAAKKKRGTKKPKAGDFKVGDHVWVEDAEDGGVWDGIIDLFYDAPTGQVAKISTSSGSVFDTPVTSLRSEEPQ